MLLKPTQKSSFRDSIKALEADVRHANTLAAAIPRDLGEESIQMKVSYSPFAPFLLFLIEWMDYSCLDRLPCCLGLLHILVYKEYVDGMTKMSSEERKASVQEFYTVIYPLLKQLEDDLLELMDDNYKRPQGFDIFSKKRMEDRKKSYRDLERDDECGICMEIGSQVVLPNCGHSMCISCYHDWYIRSQSCPFCRGNLKRVSSADLWVLTGNSDVVDTVTVAKENLRCFYLYIEKLPLVVPDNNLLLYDYLI
ncbi:hypothetical protein M9H77_10252 [Catharanthus roseus]|uniref:Uncharacterized protein n=1 Tax=Catharanthus roseus TaxID=4058 RepID=A0ACC0C389_CATRO|nr:hypothetical protein M9H77_10252 [Catharanthus roseus]